MNPKFRKKRTKKPLKRKRRWLRFIGILLGLILVICLLLRFGYPFYLHVKLPDNAPRIAFSLDNSVVGLIGITDISYERAISNAGGRLIKIRPDEVGVSNITTEKIKKMLVEKSLDGVLLTGGGDISPDISGSEPGDNILIHKLRDKFEVTLFHAARELNLPILGICRGNQVINVAMGGTVKNLRKDKELKDAHFKPFGHLVRFVDDSELRQIFGVSQLKKAISTHGQAIDKLGTDVKIAAIGPKDVIEAIEVNKPGQNEWIIGLQFHPELTFSNEIQHRIFNAFIEQARKSYEHHVTGDSNLN